MTQEMTAPSILALFETDKEQRLSFVRNTVEAMENGEIDPLKLHVQVTALSKILDIMTTTDEKKNKDGFVYAKKYKELVMDSASKYGTKTFEVFNSKVELKEVGSKYDFSKCNDPELVALTAAFDKAKEELTQRQDFLKTVSVKGLEIVNPDTGEVSKIYPPSKSSTSFLSVTLK